MIIISHLLLLFKPPGFFICMCFLHLFWNRKPESVDQDILQNTGVFIQEGWCLKPEVLKHLQCLIREELRHMWWDVMSLSLCSHHLRKLIRGTEVKSVDVHGVLSLIYSFIITTLG